MPELTTLQRACVDSAILCFIAEHPRSYDKRIDGPWELLTKQINHFFALGAPKIPSGTSEKEAKELQSSHNNARQFVLNFFWLELLLPLTRPFNTYAQFMKEHDQELADNLFLEKLKALDLKDVT